MLLNIKKYCLFLAMLPVMSLTACSSSDSGGCKTNQECSPPTPYCDLVSGDCVACLADCSSRECGPDPACGTSCGECTGGEVCREGLCICKPQASSGCHQGDVWWFDSCGNPESLIADCPRGCSGSQCTDCTPDCGNRECGPDPVCGASCGVCTGGKTCQDGSCGCAPRASVGCHNGDIWWLDSCGTPEELIAECTYGCKDGQCQECIPDCGNRECGPDPVCSTSCGDCPGGEVCTADGLCRPEDMPCPEEGCPPGMYCDLGTNRCVAGCMEDSQCSSNELCDVQTHKCVCKSEYHRCSGACVSDSSTATCGTRCTPCPTDPHGTTTCNAGACGIECHAGYLTCSGECSACPPSEGVLTFDCSDGRCVVTECQRGYRLCSDACCAWSISDLGSGRDPSLALDRSDNLRVSYIDIENNALIYARWTGNSWSTEVADPRADSRYTSLELDSGDNPHICYAHLSNEVVDVKYAWWTGNSWTVETVDTIDYRLEEASLALDSRDLPHVIYIEYNPDYENYEKTYWLYHRQKLDSGAWSWEDLIDWSVVSVYHSIHWRDISLAIDINDNPHFTYYASHFYAAGDQYHDINEERYVLRTADSWSTEVIAEFKCDGGLSLSLDDGGVPHIACCLWDNGKLTYARYETDTGWLVEEIESGSGYCRDPSMELDHLGNPHITFEATNYAGDTTAMYARRKEGPDQIEHWTIDCIDTVNYQAQPKIKIDSAGSPHIIYYDSTSSSMKYAH